MCVCLLITNAINVPADYNHPSECFAIPTINNPHNKPNTGCSVAGEHDGCAALFLRCVSATRMAKQNKWPTHFTRNRRIFSSPFPFSSSSSLRFFAHPLQSPAHLVLVHSRHSSSHSSARHWLHYWAIFRWFLICAQASYYNLSSHRAARYEEGSISMSQLHVTFSHRCVTWHA